MRYVDSEEGLPSICDSLARCEWAAIDTEADSLHHYVEKLCLLQIAVAGENFVVDPLSRIDLQPVVDALSGKFLILHGADFDVRILKRFYKFIPKEIFDTMIAAQILGYEKQGLADLAKRHCDVALAKSSQKADWSKRPLGEVLVAYAANDVHYLKTISDKMRDELVQLGRLEWHKQSCEKLLKSLNAGKDPKAENEYPWQVKGSKELNGKELAILKEFWLWREEEAKKRDKPSFHILHSATMIDVVKWVYKNPASDIAAMTTAPRHLSRGYRDALNDLIKKVKDLPPIKFFEEKKPRAGKRMDEKGKERFDKLKKEREKITSELKIQPFILITNSVLEILAKEMPKTREDLLRLDCLLPWQAEMFGESILSVTASQNTLPGTAS